MTALGELAGVRAYERERREVERAARRAVTELEDCIRDLRVEK